jgi:phage nucleotide-binding protein
MAATRVVANAPQKYSLDAVSAKIKPASALKSPLRMCVYAHQKVGKTRFAGSSNLKTLLIDCRDKGTETVSDRPNVDVFPVDEYPEIDEAFWLLSTQNAKRAEPYELYVIDNITMLATIAMKHILGERARDQVAKPLIPRTDQWNEVTQMLNNVILEWTLLPMHGLFLAQEKTYTINDPEKDGETVERIAPALSPAALGTLLGAVDTIGRLYVKEVDKEQPDGTTKTVSQRRMLLTARPPFAAGTRTKGLPPIMANPTLQKILDIRAKAGDVEETQPDNQ